MESEIRKCTICENKKKNINKNIKAYDKCFTLLNNGLPIWEDKNLQIGTLVKTLQKFNSDIESIGDFKKIMQYEPSIRAIINRSPYWPTGVEKIQHNVESIYTDLKEIGRDNLKDIVYLDLGCGKMQPYCISAVFYINGISQAYALDIEDTISTRAAITLYDLLVECLLWPDKWHFSPLPREEFIRRIYNFDLESLRKGVLANGIKSIPITHIVSDISKWDTNQHFDLISSRVVLEHLLEFEKANIKIFNLLTPGGIATHKIDLSDHQKKRGGHPFSFLAIDDWKGDTNRLRSCEIREIFLNIGYEIIKYKEFRTPLPKGFREKMLPKYQHMDQNSVEVVEVQCILQRPLIAQGGKS